MTDGSSQKIKKKTIERNTLVKIYQHRSQTWECDKMAKQDDRTNFSKMLRTLLLSIPVYLCIV